MKRLGKVGARMLVPALIGCIALAAAGLAWASGTFTVHAYFTPDKLGAPTNISASSVFSFNTATPTAVINVLGYGPAGIGVDARGTGTCEKARLEDDGPSGCPADSRIGFGGGVGVLELAKEPVHEPFTLDFFLARREDGRLVILVYVEAIDPVSVQLVLVAHEIHAPKPYGLGFSATVPPVPTLPAGSDGSVESAFLTFGSTNVAYYRTVHGRRTLMHVRGVIAPKSCPSGGFPIEGIIGFADGTTSTGKTTIPCPHG